MAVSKEFARYVEDQLVELGQLEFKNMFGGIGIFKDGLMFAKIGNDTFYLKVNETNKKQFEEMGMKPFHSPNKNKGMPYWQVPEEVLKDRLALIKWAVKSIEIAKAARKDDG